MRHSSRIKLLILPSLISGVTTVLLSAAVLGTAIYSYLSGKGMVYEYLFGPNSSAELIRQSRGTISAFSDTVFGNQTLTKVLYFAFWMIVGLVVYLILHTLIKGASVAAEDIQESTYKNIRVRDMLTNIGTRLAVRLAALTAWIVYWVFFIKTLLPLSVLLARTGTTDLSSPTGWLYGVSGLTVLVLSIHVHLIFLRLVALRARLFETSEV